MISKNMSMFLRGIGVFLVILAHYSQWYLTITDSKIVWVLSKTGRYGVAIFFIVSGYGLVFSAEKGLDFRWICRRIYNVYLPYLCIQGMICLLEKEQWTLASVGRYIFAMDAWFIFVIIILYILFYVVWKLDKCRIIWMAVGVSVFSIVLALSGKSSVWYSSNFAFLIGVAVGQYDESVGTWIRERKKICCSTLLVGFLCSGVIYTYFTNKSEYIYATGKIFASVLWSLLILCFFAYGEKTNRVIMKVGTASLEAYLIHIFVLQRLSEATERIGVEAILLGALLLSLIFAQVLHKFFEWLAKV